ncbi:MAG: TRAP transporter small permease [Desulfobacterales bacterium]|jgi:TRAP-type C4-dicarboxylate transport system permease small subunit
MTVLEKIFRILNHVFIWASGLCLAAMILMTCANIFLRIVWIPLKGTYELMGYFGALVTAFALGYTQMKKGHIAVDVLVTLFNPKAQKLLQAASCLICTIFFSIAGWQIYQYATILWKTGEVTETLRIAYYPFAYGVACGCLLLALVMLIEFLQLLFTRQEAR